MTKERRMNPVMAIDHTEDIHVKRILVLRFSGDLALGREETTEKLG